MNRPMFSAMSHAAFIEIVESIQTISVRHHGAMEGCLQQVDYAAAAMFAFVEMVTADLDSPAQRHATFEHLLRNLGRMSARVEQDGMAGILGGDLR